jgi:hypothetical protein
LHFDGIFVEVSAAETLLIFITDNHDHHLTSTLLGLQFSSSQCNLPFRQPKLHLLDLDASKLIVARCLIGHLDLIQ